MSGYLISTEFSQYVIAALFLVPNFNPVFFAVFLLDFREGYLAVVKFITESFARLCKALLSVYLFDGTVKAPCAC